MRKISKINLLSAIGVGLVFCINVYAAEKESGYSILRKAEEKRAPWNQMELVATLHTQKNNSQSLETYSVLFKDESKTLVRFVEPKFEKGNLLLMVKDDLWYFVKNTSKPIRITPIQRLSGSVSYGDITRLGWTQDYNIEKFTTDDSRKEPFYKFALKAKSKGATYQTITLYIDKNYRPKIAEVFLLSGKHYKTLKFSEFSEVSGKEINTEIMFIDHLNNEKVSVMNFIKINPKNNLPERYFIKTALPDLSNEL